jgi:hypothetical protein
LITLDKMAKSLPVALLTAFYRFCIIHRVLSIASHYEYPSGHENIQAKTSSRIFK